MGKLPRHLHKAHDDYMSHIVDPNFNHNKTPFTIVDGFGIVSIIDGLILIITFGNYSSNFTLKWNIKRRQSQIDKDYE